MLYVVCGWWKHVSDNKKNTVDFMFSPHVCSLANVTTDDKTHDETEEGYISPLRICFTHASHALNAIVYTAGGVALTLHSILTASNTLLSFVGQKQNFQINFDKRNRYTNSNFVRKI